ncbi:MAG: helix-turn-helix transcriptional regulator [Clostridia bacterium]|nr:helix-turn-helix transcriptional regulator [Clostridia bacterium]
MFFSENDHTLELLGVFKINRNKFYHESVDGRSYDCIGFRISGNSSFTYDKKEYYVTPEDIIYLPHNIHYSQVTEGETIISINFINYSSAGKHELEILHLDCPDKYNELILKMHKIWTKKEPGYKHLCTSILYEILYMANRQLSADILDLGDYNSIMSDAAEYMHKNYKRNNISILEIAAKYSISETYFRKLFNKRYMTSPMQYIISLRLEYASQLLLSRYYTITEVAEKAGFNDPKYFSRIFKKHYGYSPRRYINEFDDNMLDLRSNIESIK